MPFFWTSTEHNNYFSWHRVLINNYDTFGRVNQGGKGFGMSVKMYNLQLKNKFLNRI